MYPAESIRDYSREQSIDDLLSEHETEIRRCLKKRAHKAQVDFTDPSGHLLSSFIDLDTFALSRFSAEERRRIGVHTCPGNDLNSTHTADVDYAELLPSLFGLRTGNFQIALTSEPDRRHALDNTQILEAESADFRRSSCSDRPTHGDPRRSARPFVRTPQGLALVPGRRLIV
jgi:5-methyltetrahydropteroyltriglutamate--homocysteine methyltransferase